MKNPIYAFFFLLLCLSGGLFAQEDTDSQPASGSLTPGLRSYSWIRSNFLTEYLGEPALYRNGVLVHQETDLRVNGYIFPNLLSVNGFVTLTNGDLTLFSEPMVKDVTVDLSEGADNAGMTLFRPAQTFGEKWPNQVSGAMQAALDLESQNIRIASSFGVIKPYKTKTGSIFYRSFSDPDAMDGIVEIYTPEPWYVPEIEGDVGFYANFRSKKTAESEPGTLENVAIGTIQVGNTYIEATQILLSDAAVPSKYFDSFDSRSVMGATWSNGTVSLKGQGLYRYKTDGSLEQPFWIAGLANWNTPLLFLEGDVRYAGDANVVDTTDEAVLYKAGINDNRFKPRVKGELKLFPLSVTLEEIVNANRNRLEDNTFETYAQLTYAAPPVTPVVRTWIHHAGVGDLNEFTDVVYEGELGYKDLFSLTLLYRGAYDEGDSTFSTNYGTLTCDLSNLTKIPVTFEGRWTPAKNMESQEYLLKSVIKPASSIELTPMVNVLLDSSDATAPFGFNFITSMTTPWNNLKNPMAFLSLGYNMNGFDKAFNYKALEDIDMAKGASITLGLISDFY